MQVIRAVYIPDYSAPTCFVNLLTVEYPILAIRNSDDLAQAKTPHLF